MRIQTEVDAAVEANDDRRPSNPDVFTLVSRLSIILGGRYPRGSASGTC